MFFRRKKESRAKSEHPFFAKGETRAIGHRGAAAFVPENTLQSFARAFADGADAIECDLRLTKDGAVVIMHDARVDRTTEGTGSLSAMTLEEVRKFDAGYRFTPDGGKTFPFRGKGLLVPTLEEMLAAFPDRKFYLEIKETSAALIEKTLKAVWAAGMEDKILVVSNTPAATDMIAGIAAVLDSKVALSAPFREAARNVLGRSLKGEKEARYEVFSVPPRWPDGKKLSLPIPTKAFNRRAARNGKYVIVWTINDEKDMERHFSRGADALISDDPGKIRKLLAKNKFRT